MLLYLKRSSCSQMISTLTDNNREMTQVTSQKMKMTVFDNATHTQEVICVLPNFPFLWSHISKLVCIMFAVGMWYETGEQLKFLAEKCSFFRQQRAAVLFQWFIMGYKKHGKRPRFVFLSQSHYCFPLFSFLWLYADHRYTAGVSAVPPL